VSSIGLYCTHYDTRTLNNSTARINNSSARINNSSARINNSSARINNSSARINNSSARINNSSARIKPSPPRKKHERVHMIISRWCFQIIHSYFCLDNTFVLTSYVFWGGGKKYQSGLLPLDNVLGVEALTTSLIVAVIHSAHKCL